MEGKKRGSCGALQGEEEIGDGRRFTGKGAYSSEIRNNHIRVGIHISLRQVSDDREI